MVRRPGDGRSNTVRARRDEAPACVLGDADVWVSNVSPHFAQHFPGEEGGVEFILHVDWPDPLDVAYTISVEDLPPIDIQN